MNDGCTKSAEKYAKTSQKPRRAAPSSAQLGKLLNKWDTWEKTVKIQSRSFMHF